jgi:hypothetical protein
MFHPLKIFASLTLPSQSSAESHSGLVMMKSDPQHPLLAVLMAYKQDNCEKQYSISFHLTFFFFSLERGIWQMVDVPQITVSYSFTCG